MRVHVKYSPGPGGRYSGHQSRCAAIMGAVGKHLLPGAVWWPSLDGADLLISDGAMGAHDRACRMGIPSIEIDNHYAFRLPIPGLPPHLEELRKGLAARLPVVPHTCTLVIPHFAWEHLSDGLAVKPWMPPVKLIEPATIPCAVYYPEMGIPGIRKLMASIPGAFVDEPISREWWRDVLAKSRTAIIGAGHESICDVLSFKGRHVSIIPRANDAEQQINAWLAMKMGNNISVFNSFAEAARVTERLCKPVDVMQ